MNVKARLAQLGLELPEVPRPIPSFVPWRKHGSLVFLSAQNCVWNGVMVHQGKVGRDLEIDQAATAARLCALNLVAALREALDGDLGRVQSCMRLGGFVHCTPEFESAARVIDGASDLICDLFGADGIHSRTAIGVVQLPLNAAVAVDAIFEVH